MSEQDEIIESVLANFSEYDANVDACWHFTDKEIRSLIAMTIEQIQERMLDPVAVGRKLAELTAAVTKAHAAVECLGVSLADSDHVWTNDQRKAWERAESLLRDQLRP